MFLTKQQIRNIQMHAIQHAKYSRIPRLVCPICNGGSTKESSFSVTATPEGILYNCYRDSCRIRGFIRMGDSVRKKPVINLRKFTKETTSLNDEDYDNFEEYFGLSKQDIDDNLILKCPENGAYVIPIYDLTGLKIGTELRVYKWQKNTKLNIKSIYYKELDRPKIYLPRSSSIGDTMVIVEDVMSAIKTAKIKPCIALLGTNLEADIITTLHKLHVKKLVVLLDPDATRTSLKIKKNNDLYFDSIRISILKKDPKDTDHEVLSEAILGDDNENKDAIV